MAKLDELYRAWRQSGTDESLNSLIGSVRSLAYRIAYDDDAAQTASLVVLTKLNKFKPIDETAFTRWVNRVIRLERLTTARAQLRSTDEFDDQTFDRRSEISFVDTSGLPDFERSVAESLLAGHSLKETATHLGMQPTALRKRLERYRKASTRFPLTQRGAR
jgi:DNA-directed RNA polymerase specialized sigma24 family protein